MTFHYIQRQADNIAQPVSKFCELPEKVGFLFATGLLTASMATTCYKCTGLVDEAFNGAYSGNVDHEVNCTLNSDTEDDGCSKSKSSVTLLGVKVTTGLLISNN